jgi:hypothetical protein
MTIGRLPRSRHECDNPTRILTVGEKVQYVENADDSESATHIRVTYRCTDEAMGQIYQSLQQQASILSYIDALQTLAIFCACMVPLVLLMKHPPKGTTAAVH